MLKFKVQQIEIDPFFGEEITIKIENNYPTIDKK